MNTPEEMIDLLMHTWGEKTLEALRLEAIAQPTGIMFDAVRANGKRVMFIVCITDPVQIERLRGVLRLTGEALPPEDWTKLTLLETAIRVSRGPGFGFESLHDAAGRMSALALIASAPRSISMLEAVFKRV